MIKAWLKEVSGVGWWAVSMALITDLFAVAIPWLWCLAAPATILAGYGLTRVLMDVRNAPPPPDPIADMVEYKRKRRADERRAWQKEYDALLPARHDLFTPDAILPTGFIELPPEIKTRAEIEEWWERHELPRLGVAGVRAPSAVTQTNTPSMAVCAKGLILPIQSSDPIHDRYDVVYERGSHVYVMRGTPAAAPWPPTPPSIVTPLAIVHVQANTMWITNAMIATA